MTRRNPQVDHLFRRFRPYSCMDGNFNFWELIAKTPQALGQPVGGKTGRAGDGNLLTMADRLHLTCCQINL
jgi:hypothetical protein